MPVMLQALCYLSLPSRCLRQSFCPRGNDNISVVFSFMKFNGEEGQQKLEESGKENLMNQLRTSGDSVGFGCPKETGKLFYVKRTAYVEAQGCDWQQKKRVSGFQKKVSTILKISNENGRQESQIQKCMLNEFIWHQTKLN